MEKANGIKVATYSDHRKLLEDKAVDAVVVSTPDHWHALASADALVAGKDVYCEKPLTVPDSAPPPELDYDRWLGPAPYRPYNKNRVHYLFRFFWDYSGGQMTYSGAHHLDIMQWALGMDESGPVDIEGTAKWNAEKLYETPETFQVRYRYANGTVVECNGGDGKYKGGCTFEGEKGVLYAGRGAISFEPASIGEEPLQDSDLRLYPELEKLAKLRSPHHANWLECIKTRKLPICDVAIGHRSATVCHLGNIAIRTGKQVKWDPVKEEIVGDAETAKLVSKAYRAPWQLPAV